MSKQEFVIFLGDVSEYLGVLAKNYDASAWLLDKNNYLALDNKLSNGAVTVYTSLGDLPRDLVLVVNILSKATTIYYRPPKEWSDHKTIDIIDPGASIQGLTETLLLLLPDSVKVDGLNTLTPLHYNPVPLVDERKTDSKQLWVAGCSISHGDGVQSNECYGYLLATELELKCSFLTRPGSAIDWAADQILRSDIRENDIVVWGITSWNRLTYIHDNQLLNGVTVKAFDYFPEYKKIVNIRELSSQQTFYKHFYSIEQVKNYCKKIKAKLYLVGLIHTDYTLLSFLKSQPNYIHIPYKFSNTKNFSDEYEDLGSDNLHPGPKQHQQYKNIILKHILNSN